MGTSWKDQGLERDPQGQLPICTERKLPDPFKGKKNGILQWGQTSLGGSWGDVRARSGSRDRIGAAKGKIGSGNDPTSPGGGEGRPHKNGKKKMFLTHIGILQCGDNGNERIHHEAGVDMRLKKDAPIHGGSMGTL